MDTDASSPGLSDRLLRGMSNAGLHAPTPFQEEILRLGMEGRNVLAIVKPGEELVASVVLPALQQCARTADSRTDRSPRSLIITSSRDRARTLQRGALALGKFLSLRAVALYGGVSVESQVPLLQAGAEVLIATPDRLLDHLRQGTVSVAALQLLVLDDTDRLLNEGSLESFGSIMQNFPANFHTILFTAQKSEKVLAFAAPFLGDAVEVTPGEGEREKTLRSTGTHRRHPQHGGSPHPLAKRGARSGPPRHTSPVRHTSPARHTGSVKRTGSVGHPGTGKHPGISNLSGAAKHSGAGKHTGASRHPNLTLKGKKKPRRTSSATLTAPRKKRPPKRLDSFSSDSGGAGWSSY